MALPSEADQVVIQGFWLDELTTGGVNATITSDPVPLPGQASLPNVLDAVSHTFIKTRQRVATPNNTTGYWAVLALSTNDPDLDAYGGRRITFAGEAPKVIEVSALAQYTTVTQQMKTAVPSLTLGAQVRAVWFDEAASFTPPPAGSSYYTSAQTDSLIATILAAYTIPWSRVTGAPTSLPPSGGAGGVLSGTYPNPGFAVDMATQAELDAVVAGVPEQARDAVGAALVAGAGVQVSVNDAADTITITATGGGGGSYTDEQVQDAFAALIAAGTHTGISFTYDDAGNALSATVAYGTSSNSAARGNDSRLSDNRTPIDGSVTDAKVAPGAAIAESKLALASDAAPGTASRRSLGTGSAQAAAGSDSRLSDQRTPIDGSVTDAKVVANAAIAETKLALASDAAAGTASRRSLGSSATQAAAGNHTHAASAPAPHATTHGSGGSDPVSPSSIGAVSTSDSRLSDARTPTMHKSTHAAGGSDALAPSDIGALPVPAARVVTAASTGAALTVANGELILADGTNGPVPLVLAANAVATVKRTDAVGTNLVTVAAPSGKTIGDQAAGSVPLRTRGQAQTYVPNSADATNVVILNGHYSLSELEARFGTLPGVHLAAWAAAQAWTWTSKTVDANETPTSGSIAWPDGSTGTYTTDVASTSTPGAVDAWHATYVPTSGATRTVTQAAVTRDTAGTVTAQPAITVA